MAFTPDLIAMLVAGLLTGALALRLWPVRSQTAVFPLMAAMAFASCWALDVFVEFSIADPAWKYALVMAKPFAVLGVVSCLAILAVEHTGSLGFIRRARFSPLLIVPAITLVLTFVPEKYALYRYNFHLRSHGPLLATTWDSGPWQEFLHYYFYGVALLACGVIVQAALHAHRTYRRVMLLTAASWLAPFAGDFTSHIGITSQETDLTAWGICFAALVSGWALLVERVFNVAPVARGAVVEWLGDLLFVIDTEGKLVDWNRRGAAAVGLPRERLRARPIRLEELPPPWPEILRPTGSADGRATLGDGADVRTYERAELPLLDKRNRPLGHSILLHDISHLEAMRRLVDDKNAELAAANASLQAEIEQRLATEARLLEAGRMETVGRLAGGVAHDFNNLLTVINGYSGIVLSRLEPGVNRNAVEQIAKAGERAAELTGQLLAFSRRQTIQPRVMNLNAAIRDAWTILGRVLPENIERIADLAPTLGNIMADPGQIHQVLMNLAANARDAMPNGGKFIVETANVHLDREYAASHPEVTPGPCVLLAVTDDGTGMEESVRTHIFEPFFTTKGIGSGPGWGWPRCTASCGRAAAGSGFTASRVRGHRSKSISLVSICRKAGSGLRCRRAPRAGTRRSWWWRTRTTSAA